MNPLPTASVFAVLVLLPACSDSGVTKFNNEPTATITSHGDGDTVKEGYVAVLVGAVGDANDGFDTLAATWLVGGVEVCPETVVSVDGLVTCEHTFAIDGGAVVLQVSDPQGGSGADRVTLEVVATDAPTAEIVTPEAAGTYYSDQIIAFSGTIGDGEDAPDALIVTWEDEVTGDLGLEVDVGADGAITAYGRLAEGEHQVRLHVIDTSGKEAQDSVVIVVGPPNAAPTCAFTAPEDGSAGPEGSEVRFEGQVADADVPADQLVVGWSSNLDGSLGTATPDTDGRVRFAWSDLSVGTHLVTLTASDEVRATCTTSVYYTVGNPPTLILTSPTDGDTYNTGEEVVFAATVSDSEDQPTDIDLSWESDVDGVFSTARADSSGEVSVRTSSLTAGDHTLSVTATDPDGLYVIRDVSLTVNALPTAPTVTLSPDPAGTDDALTAIASGSLDPDTSGTVTYSYAWYADGVLSSASSSSAFPSADTTKDHTYRVVVTPNDGAGDGPSGEATLTVSNTAPTLVGPTVSPSTAQIGETLTCAASATDADAETPTVTYAWSDGTSGSTTIVGAGTDPGDTVTCTATADDGDGGTATGSATATVSNTDPTVSRPYFSPDDPQVGDTLTCHATLDDADGGTPTASYAWSDGSTAQTYTVVATDDPGDTITCTVTATDADGGTGSASTSETVVNTDPVVTGVSVGPTGATNADVVTCTGTATDADGGIPSLTYVWDNLTSGSSLGTGEVLDLATVSVASGDTLRCTATASDTDGGSGSDSATLGVTNRAPSVSVTLSPSTARTDDTLTISASTADADGDTLAVTYTWYVDGSVVQAGSGTTLDGTTHFDKGEEVTVAATADDGITSTTVTTAGLLIDNTAPGAPSVSISPAAPAAGDHLLCVVDTASADDDADTVTYTMSWTVDGSAHAGADTTTWTGDTVDGGDVAAGEVWICTAMPNDGEDDGATTTASVTATSSGYSGTISMPSAGTVDGFNHGEWSALNGGGRVAARVVLTSACVNPILAFYQHSTADTSIQGSYYVMNSSGTVLAYSPYDTYSGCNDCWLPHPTALSVTLSASTTYYLGFQNGTGGDMSGPSIYLDATARTVGIATFDDPRADRPSTPTRGLPSTTVSWQNRWQIDCE